MSKLRTSLLAPLMALTVIGCGGDDDPLGVNSGDPLTEEELQVVFFAISDAFQSIGAGAAPVGPARATVPVNESFSDSAPCASGGTMSASGSANGTVDDVTYELDLRYQFRMTPNGCAVPTETATITLDGAPYIQFDMDFYLSETELDVSGTQTGGIAYTSTDGRSGSCAFDVSFSVSVNLDTQVGNSSVSGTVCGVSATNLTVFEVDA